MRKLSELRTMLSDIWALSRETRRTWLFLVAALLLFLGMIVVLTESSAILPFIYTLF